MSIFDSPGLTATPTSSQQNTVAGFAAPYVGNMLSQAQALANTPMPAYTGQLTAGTSPLQQQAFQGVAGLTVPGQFQQATDMTNQAAATGQQAGAQGQSIGMAGGDLYGQMGSQAGQQGQQIGTQQGFGYGAMGAQAGASYGQNATNPYAVQAYMNPYLQNALAPSLELLNQQYGIQNAGQQGAATSAGAFGGSREALMQGLNNQNRSLAQNQLVSNAYNQAYNTANTNMQQAANLGMQGAQVGLSGVNAQLAGTAQGMQGAQAGLQGINTQLAGTAQGMQGAQLGLQGGAQLGQLGTAQLGAQQNILNQQAGFGAQQQAIEQAGLTAQYNQYLQQLQYPQTMLKLQSGMLQGLPISTQNIYGAMPSTAQNVAGGIAGLASMGNSLFGNSTTNANGITTSNPGLLSGIGDGISGLYNGAKNLFSSSGGE